MATIELKLTPAMEAHLVAQIYRHTRTSCLSLSAVCARISHDRLQRLLNERFAWSRRLWETFAARLVREGGYLILKQEFGWGEASAPKMQAQRAHLLSGALRAVPERAGGASPGANDLRAEAGVITAPDT